MTTTAQARSAIETWMESHSDVQPYNGSEPCARILIERGKRPTLCGSPAEWLKDFAAPSLGRRTYCTRCLVGLIRTWRVLERREATA